MPRYWFKSRLILRWIYEEMQISVVWQQAILLMLDLTFISLAYANIFRRNFQPE